MAHLKVPVPLPVLQQPIKKQKTKCDECGGNQHKSRKQKCKAYNQVYTSCKKIGHFQAVCRGHHWSTTAPRPKTITVKKEAAMKAAPKAAQLKLHQEALHMAGFTQGGK